ncbi:MFS transporter [Clostridium sp. SHJSY1]|uniref:MDR family MFS transporter n=1 Tax=Clostridium sp. SHJSY1 TaxID=2942483 RepID=UPI0028759408|nr:MFS transporter [Clostridium sp. SHJSY1]MDS0526724.1 MFS transporter [Clostridium sp. SHJSY1]
MNIFKTYKGLPKSIYALFFVQVINRLGDFVFPFLSLLLSDKLNFSYTATGLVVTITSLVQIPSSILGGRLADLISRKKIYLVGQGVAALAVFICGIINNSYIIVVLLITSAFFNGFVRPTISAVMADVLTSENRQIGNSLSYLGINIGVSLGPIIAGFLFENYLTLLFILDAVSSFVAVMIFYIFIEETKPKEGNNEIVNLNEKEESGNLIQVLLKKPNLTFFLIISMFYSFAYSQINFSMPMTLNEVFKSDGAKFFGYLISVNAITVVFLTVVIINITKKFKSLFNIIFAGIFYAIGFGMIGLIGSSFLLFIISTVLWSIGEILSSTNNGVYIANNSPMNFRARISAVYNISKSLAAAFGTSTLGKFIDNYGVSHVWTLIFITTTIGVGFMIALHLYNLRNIKKQIISGETFY